MEKIWTTFSIVLFLLLCFQRGIILVHITKLLIHFMLFLMQMFPIVAKCSEDEERLVRDLFRGYNKLIRPVQNMTQKVDVRFGLAFVQLINVVRIIQKKKQKSQCCLSNRPANRLDYSSFLFRMKKIRLWNRTYGWDWYGVITNCSGMKLITVALGSCGCRQIRSGNPILCFLTSE